MSFGGSVLAMIISLKNNARPKRKAFEGVKDFNNRAKYNSNKLCFNEVPAEELEKIKYKIRREAKTHNRIQFFIKLGLVICFLMFLAFLSLNFYQTQLGNSLTQKRKATLKEIKEERVLNEKFMFLINDGYEWMENGNFHNAKYQFKEASELKPNDFTAKIATLKAYIFDCIENNVKCKTAEHLLNKCLAEYPEDTEVIEVARLFDYNKK